jgi:hypothetical protein
MDLFLRGAIAMACWVAGLFFLRFWRETRDRLFLFFLVAFWLFAVHWAALAGIEVTAERRHYVYALRLIVFALIIAGIVDKNRRTTKA